MGVTTGISILLGVATVGLLAWIFWPGTGLRARTTCFSDVQKIAMEDALRYLYTLHGDREAVSLDAVSRASGIPIYMLRAAVGELIARGMARGSVEEGVRLTPDGRTRALALLRAHRLWEQYLLEEEDMPLDQVHRAADMREHEISAAELEELSEHLGHPKHDPHGEPIPDASGAMEEVEGVLLGTWPVGKTAEVVQIEDEPQALVDQIVAMGLTPGSQLQVLQKTPKRLLVESAHRQHVIARSLADQIVVNEAPAQAVPLSSLEVGEKGRVKEVRETGRMLRRLLDMGLVPGAMVEVSRKAPLGDPVEYRVMGSSVSLRRDLASRVLVEPLDGAEGVGGVA